ncbi:unknown protein [Paenibacillus amylolyticus]|uniref:Uncharacterized protein n=1 Tax=Paenibacillus amylolyticus TaxID=1451 RepID=A0A100VN32_PAEAM|nr:unknown protein [Paenibacillus amylolyticus]
MYHHSAQPEHSPDAAPQKRKNGTDWQDSPHHRQAMNEVSKKWWSTIYYVS